MRAHASIGRKGDVISPVVMWIGVILAVLIAGAWFMFNLHPVQRDTDAVQHDLSAIRTAVERGCLSKNYTRHFNPRTEQGMLVVSGTKGCINTTTVAQCAALTCPVPAAAIDLQTVTTIIIKGDGGAMTISGAS